MNSPPPVPFGQGQAPPLNPYYSAQSVQDVIDNEHLRLLRIGYFISAGQTAIFVPFGLLYAVMGVAVGHLAPGGAAPPPSLLPLFFGIGGSVIAGLAGVASVLKLVTGMRLKERRARTLCLITAGITAIEIPYGTALGLMTISVLGRASVRRQFMRSG
jgi:hypothetical protein